MRRWYRSSLLVLLVVLAMAVTACSQAPADSGDNGEGPDGDNEPVTLTIATPYSIETLDPTKYSSDGDYYVLSQIYEPLVNVLADGTVIYRLAESLETPDDTTFIFHLRENIYWQDGNEVFEEGAEERVTAEDVKYTYDFILDAENGFWTQPKLESIIESVEVIDENTIQFKITKPYAYFLDELDRVAIISQKVMDTLGRDEMAKNPIGAGPFEFVEYSTDDRVVLRANEDFFVTPNVDEVIFRIIPDKSVGLIALETGEVDIALQIPSTEVERVLSEDKIKLVPNDYGWYRYTAFNFENPLFQDLRVREAFAYATDKETAVRNIFPTEQLAEVAYGPVPRGILGFSDDWNQYWEFNLEKAQEFLTEAGWTDTDGDEIVDKDGTPMSFTLQVPNDPNRQKLAVLQSTQWQKVGIDAQVVTNDWATHLEQIEKGDTEMFIMGGGSTPDGLTYMFHSEMADGAAHDTRWKNAEFDELINTAIETVDADARAELWQEAAEMTIMDRVHLPGYLEYVQVGMQKSVEGFDPVTPWVSLANEYRNVSK